MQNEITELRNQVRTLKRIVCLVCCLFALFCSIGCQGCQVSPPITFTPHYNELTGEWESRKVQLDSPHLRKQGPTAYMKQNNVFEPITFTVCRKCIDGQLRMGISDNKRRGEWCEEILLGNGGSNWILHSESDCQLSRTNFYK